MLRITFLADLKDRLYGMPQEEIEERLSFYNEMINDRMEEGLSEEEAIEAIGPVDEIAAQILSSLPAEPAPAPVPEPVTVPDYAAYQPMPGYEMPSYEEKPGKSVNGFKTALLLIGFPIWGSLLIAAAAVVFSLIISVFALVISFWAVAVSLAVSVIACAVSAVCSFISGRALLGVAWIGAGLFCAGLAILLFLCGGVVTRGLLAATKKLAGGLSRLFRRKGGRS